jgi:hypothetical protein
VLAIDLGAVAERVRRHGGGILVDVNDLDGIVELLMSKGRAALDGVDLDLPAVSPLSVRPLERMAQDYAHLYSEISSRVARRGTVGFVASAGSGSSYLRTRSRVARISGSSEWDFQELDLKSFMAGIDNRHFDALLVQRDALVGVDFSAFWQKARAKRIRIIAELDDDLLSDWARTRVPEQIVDACRELISNADAVVVSTHSLGNVVSRFTNVPILVSLNLLDDVSWGNRIASPADINAPVRWVYWGTSTHAADLDIVREAFPGVTNDGRRIELDVIGVSDVDQPWFTRLDLPRGGYSYRSFVSWVRAAAVKRQWSAGVAPLVSEPFNDSKSDLKVLEYSLLGLPSLASDVPAYRGLSGLGQALVPNEPGAWATAIHNASNEISALHAQPLFDYATNERTLANRRELEKWAQFVFGDGSKR